MHCKALNAHYVRKRYYNASISCCAVWHESLAYSVHLTGEQAERQRRKNACSRTASRACFLFPIQNGKGLLNHSALNTHKLNCCKFSSSPRKKSEPIVELNPAQKKMQCVENALLVLVHWLIYYWSHYWWPASFLMTNQIAGSGDAPTTHLPCITQSCIKITSITALLCAMYEYVLVR